MCRAGELQTMLTLNFVYALANTQTPSAVPWTTVSSIRHVHFGQGPFIKHGSDFLCTENLLAVHNCARAKLRGNSGYRYRCTVVGN